MFQESSEDRTHLDVFRQARQPRAQAASAPNDEANDYAGPRCPVKGLDDLWLRQRVELGVYAGRSAGFGVIDFTLDSREQEVVQVEWGLHQFMHAGRPPEPGQLDEQRMDVLAELRVGGEEREIGICLCRALMVVARAQVHI